MRYPWVNTFLLLTIALQIVTGYLGFTSGQESERWLLWLHGIGAFAIVVVLAWKGVVIVNAYRRRKRWDLQRTAFAVMIGLLLLTLITGLLWTFVGPKYLWGFSVITLHIFVAVVLSLLVVWHLISHRWILKVPTARDRRAFLRAGVLGAAGFATWQLGNVARRGWSLPGSRRRFTGSYERGSFTGKFPQVSWINDDPETVNLSEWRLDVSGAVDNPLTLTHEELLAMAGAEQDVILDCTGGWYSAQRWSGVPFQNIAAMLEPHEDARSVTFESVTGYKRRFGLEDSADFLLATHVAGEVLSHGHGFPLRLVIPGERGVYWVKWLRRITFNKSSQYLQPPLPLQ